jgi:hypothetical protein
MPRPLSQGAGSDSAANSKRSVAQRADYFHDAIDYLLDVIRWSREWFLNELDVRHPTQWSRGAKPHPIPREFQRDYLAELRKIKAAIAQHFAERFPDRV